MKQWVVYIMTNKRHSVLYIGFSNDMKRRTWEHKQKIGSHFTQKYNVDKLVYYEIHSDVQTAIKREKQLKNLLRRKKIELIESMNPNWRDMWPDLLQ